MKLEEWPVLPNDEGIRPAGPPDACLYCQTKVGGTHKAECVVRQRTVVIRATFEVVVKRPEDWDSDLIEFGANESSSCKNNVLEEITRTAVRMGDGHCFCSFGHVEFVREATAEDEESFQVFVAERDKE